MDKIFDRIVYRIDVLMVLRISLWDKSDDSAADLYGINLTTVTRTSTG